MLDSSEARVAPLDATTGSISTTNVRPQEIHMSTDARLAATNGSVSLLSLAISGLSAAISLFAAFGRWMPSRAEKRQITACGFPFQSGEHLELSIFVSNIGRHPTTIRFVQAHLPGSPTLSFPFLQVGSARLNAGDFVETVVPRYVAYQLWKNIVDLHRLELEVVDSANKSHPISISGRPTKKSSLRQL